MFDTTSDKAVLQFDLTVNYVYLQVARLVVLSKAGQFE